MSASAPRQQTQSNPATKFLKWRGGRRQGWFEYYDKSIEDKDKRNIQVDLSKGFLILDEDLFSVTGYMEPKTSIISNEVRTVEDLLVVKGYTDGKATVLLNGSYSQLKDTIKGSNAYHYTKSIYIMFKGELCHLALTGAAFQHWLSDVQPNANHGKCWIKHVETKDGEKGNVEYKYPVFEVGAEASDLEWEKVCDLDRDVLQPYLEKYLGKGASAEPTEQKEVIDTKKWREQPSLSGVKLGEMTMEAIRELSETLVEEGKSDTPLYDYVGQALYDYQMAIKSWESKQDKSGKKLSAYTLAELRDTLSKIPKSHPSALYLMAGIDAMAATEVVDETPFDDSEDVQF